MILSEEELSSLRKTVKKQNEIRNEMVKAWRNNEDYSDMLDEYNK